MCLLAQGAMAQINPAANPDLDTPAPSNLSIIQSLEPGDVDAGEMAVEQQLDPLAPIPGTAGSAVDVEQEDTTLAGSKKTDWRLRPFGTFGVTFDDNIFISNTNRQSDVIFSINAGLTFELGDFRNLQESYLIASYAGTGYFYTNNPAQNAYDQEATLLAQYRVDKLALQLESSYQYLTGPEREVGNFVNRNIIENAVRGIYDFSDKTRGDIEFTQRTSLYQDFLSQYLYQLKIGGDYKTTERIRLGLEGIAGILNVQDGPLQYFQQIRGRARYEVTGKIALNLSGGVELREYEGDSQPVRLFPVFSVSGEYRPFSGTFINLEGYSNSYGSTNFIGQNYVATGFSLSVQQRFFSRFYAGALFGYENDTYYAVAANESVSRSDNYVVIRGSLEYKFLDWLSSGVFYEFKNNASTISQYSFYDNRVGYQLSVNF